MAVARDSTFVWTSWLARLMAGQQSCEFAAWFKAHYQYEKLASNFDVGAWTIQRGRLLRELRMERLQHGETIHVGASNSFRYQPRPGLTLAGQPDLISDDRLSNPTVYAIRVGREKATDWVETLVFMHALPLAAERHRGVQFDGCVLYTDHRIRIPAATIDARFISNFEYFLDVLAAPEAPLKAPSEAECRFCNIGSEDCPERLGAPSKLA